MLLQRLYADSSYAFVEGCDASKGCAVFLRGDSRIFLERVQRLLRTSILLAYHVRLESAFYYDRCVLLSESNASSYVDPNSDDETALQLTSAPIGERRLLSSSLDIDYIAPVPGISFMGAEEEGSPDHAPRLSVAQSTASMCFTRLKISEGGQRYVSEHKHLAFYGEGDVCLGKYLIDNCFLPFGASSSSFSSFYSRGFVHTPGRIDIQVQTLSGERYTPVPTHLIYSVPITLCSFCKVCKCKVTPDTAISEETWSMSFGKLIDILLYNRTAQGSPYGCNHGCREHHLLNFSWAGLTARLEFVPMHPFSMKVRGQLPLPESFHKQQTRSAIELLLHKSSEIFDEFKSAVVRAEAVCQEIIASDKYPQELGWELLNQVSALNQEQSSAMDTFQDSLRSSLEALGEMSEPPIYLHFPMGWKRDLCILCDGWNAQLESISNRFEELKLKGEQFSMFKSLVGNEERHPSTQPSSYSESSWLGEADNIRDKTNVESSIHNDSEADLKQIDSDRQSSISMVFALLVGAETREKRRRIHLGDVADPSLRMLPGRRGEVILVNPDEPSSIVAYSLASKEYFDQLQIFKTSMQENDESGLVNSRSEDFLQGRISPGLSKSEEFRSGKSDVAVHDLGSDVYETQAGEEFEANDILLTQQRESAVSESHYYRPTSMLHNLAVAEEDVSINAEKMLESEEYGDPRLMEASSFHSAMEKLMVLPRKSHIKHHFEDTCGDSKTHKYYCYTFWSVQFEAFRRVYLDDDSDEGYIRSLASSVQWITQGGKSGASFAKSIDGRFVMKVISKTELLMFNDFAPAYFEYMSKTLFHYLPTSLCKVNMMTSRS